MRKYNIKVTDRDNAIWGLGSTRGEAIEETIEWFKHRISVPEYNGEVIYNAGLAVDIDYTVAEIEDLVDTKILFVEPVTADDNLDQ